MYLLSFTFGRPATALHAGLLHEVPHVHVLDGLEAGDGGDVEVPVQLTRPVPRPLAAQPRLVPNSAGPTPAVREPW